ncbi:MAG TPA: hypothetical protein VFQ54_06400, partial [Thermomicrobiales bacterium]|nr:hypothetical protein [Thermomicrobiales bacterium]
MGWAVGKATTTHIEDPANTSDAGVERIQAERAIPAPLPLSRNDVAQAERARGEQRNATIILLGIMGCVGLVVGGILFNAWDKRTTADEHLVDIVQWTIGIVLTLALALVGYNWVSSNKAFERERDALDKLLDARDKWTDSELRRMD